MNLGKYIENLRAKPEHVRRRIAFLSSCTITIVVFVFWLASFTMRSGVAGTGGGVVASAVKKVDSPAQSLVASVGSLFDDVKDIFVKPKKVEYTMVEVVPGDK